MSVTEIQRARWTGRGEVMHIQVCDWPGCSSRHSLRDGPATAGWRSFGATNRKVVLCPFHSDGPHLPRLVMLAQQPLVLRAECTCAWAGATVRQVPTAVMEWQDHIADSRS